VRDLGPRKVKAHRECGMGGKNCCCSEWFTNYCDEAVSRQVATIIVEKDVVVREYVMYLQGLGHASFLETDDISIIQYEVCNLCTGVYLCKGEAIAIPGDDSHINWRDQLVVYLLSGL
jgi:hypothetical protein